jgi:hypothetical protein
MSAARESRACKDRAWNDWIAEARGVTLIDYCARRGVKILSGDRGQPCPACGGRDRFSVNAQKDLWHCRVSALGGDAIALAQHILECDFVSACEEVTGRPRPRPGEEEAQEQRQEQFHERARKIAARTQANECEQARREREAASFREYERRRARRIWNDAKPPHASPVEDYFRLRGLALPRGARLRYAGDLALWNKPGGSVIHRGPAMVAAIEGPEGRFAGVHQTWIDLSAPKGKAEIIDPSSGQELPAKKIRGSKKGGSIRLVVCEGAARRWFLGEGIETVLSVYWSLAEQAAHLIERAEFRSSVDLGNMAGKAKGRVKHPNKTRVDRNGRISALRVPDSEPLDDEPWPVIPIPSQVEELYLLGDGDSDAFTTRLALERAAKRFSRARPSLTIKLAMSRAGADFNDMRLERAA